jgi:nitroreductase
MPFRTRRSVKPAAMDPARNVPRELLWEILEDAHWAPTHGLTQPWRFHVFTGEARQKLGGVLQDLYDRLMPAADQRAEKREKLMSNPCRAPVSIVVAFRVDPDGKISETEEIAATACAVQNLMLSAHQRGLATFWSTPPVSCSPDFVRWLDLDGTYRAFGIIYLGWPLAADIPAPPRHPVADHVVFHSDLERGNHQGTKNTKV